MDYRKPAFTLKLKCGRKTCGRTLGTAKLILGAPRRITDPYHVEYVGDTFGWLHVGAPTEVPFEKHDDPENSYAQEVRYRFTCGRIALTTTYDNGEPVIPMGRDRKKVEHVGCKADHVIKRERLERELLGRLGLEPDTNLHQLRQWDLSKMIERYKADRSHWTFQLP